MTIRRYNRNAATDPERSVFTSWRVFYNYNGFFKYGFNGLPGLSVPDNKAPGGTVSCLFYGSVPGLWNI